jgi:hypothetical protein
VTAGTETDGVEMPAVTPGIVTPAGTALTVTAGIETDGVGTVAVTPGSVTPEATAFEASAPHVASAATPSVAEATRTRRIR